MRFVALVGAMGLALPCWAAPAFVFCAEAAPDGFDSALSDRAATHRAAAYPIYNRLVGYAPKTGALVPELAERWEAGDEGRSWTFTLRHGVHFQKTPWFTPTRDFNADDVLWTALRQIDPHHPGAAEAPSGFADAIAGDWRGLIESVEKVDAYTVRFKLSRAYAPFPALVASWPFSIVSAEYGVQLAKLGQLAKMATEPVGTGPYQLTKYDPGSTIRYAANPGYFRGTIAIAKLTFAIVPDSSVRAQKLRTGECSLAESLKPEDIASLQSSPAVAITRYRPQATSFLAFNTQHKPFGDSRVRRALSLAIDRRAIVSAVFASHAGVGSAPYAADSLWGAPKANEASQDLQAAKRLLADAGYPNGFTTSIWVTQGGSSNNVNPKLTAELVQADWAKLGVRAEIVPFDAAELGRRSRAGEHETVISGWRNSIDPDELYANLLTCDAAKSSTARWCDPAFDRLIEAARGTLDQATRSKRYEAAAARFIEQAPWAVLAYPEAAIASDRRLGGVEPSPAAPFAFDRLFWR
ncbi:MAG: ABC transporter substrate-binding protein [Burkholderiales bacterium]|nr:ABC transporter substrate-binding protein [Burkholderiales bacterium]